MQHVKTLSFFLTLALLASSTLYANPYWRHGGFRSFHRHPGFSFYFGVPWYPRPYFSYPYYYPYYPPVVTVPTEPPVYIERDPPQSQQLPSGYWYYCDNPEGYYPYIQECPHGWRQVDPIPPN
ncbi:MAG: hypothetical protein ACU836_09030 [Gammaproteobacteria bacterium]